MNRLISLIIFFTVGFSSSFSQTTIKGKIADAGGQALPGANVMIRGSYEGASSNEAGEFVFTTTIKGDHTLAASFIGYLTGEKMISLDEGEITVDFILEEDRDQIGDVVISAGVFETSDKKKSVTLQSLDIVTTPSAAGDIYGALTSLPGTTMAGEDGRLFVRGGDGYESKTFIDGLLVKKPYSSTTPDLPGRGRFSPFLFSGTMFSTGGYSAEYGQALSSALILTTNAFPEKTQTELSLLSVGMGATQTFRSENASVSAGVEYFNMKPYNELVKQRVDWETDPNSISGVFNARYRIRGKGLLKVFSTISEQNCALMFPEMSQEGSLQKISLKNLNNYTNINYTGEANNGWIVKTGLSFTYDTEKVGMRAFGVSDQNTNLQGKVVVKKSFPDKVNLLFGMEEVFNRFHERYTENESGFVFDGDFDDYNTAVFAESEVRVLPRLAIRTGLRGEHSSVIGKSGLSFRSSAGWAIHKNWQASLAYGTFYQTPEESLLRFTQQLDFEKASHYIANLQYEARERILRIEGYYKQYDGLVIYNAEDPYNPLPYNNLGKGYSRGIDFFFRDRRSVKGLDYWISYSLIDARRHYRHYPEEVTPSFVSKHNLSVVAKKYVEAITTQFGAMCSWSSGRPYNDPNETTFMNGITRDYLDVSVNISYLTTLFKKSTIVYFSCSNLFGRDNIYSYRYYETPNSEGMYGSLPVRPEARRFLLAGLFVTL